MTKSSASEPPILADAELARNCFGLNATVLPGLGTFRAGAHLRGLLEMGVAIGGTLLFCGTFFSAVGNRSEDMTLSQAILPYLPRILLSVGLVIGSWISGIFYAKSLFRR